MREFSQANKPFRWQMVIHETLLSCRALKEREKKRAWKSGRVSVKAGREKEGPAVKTEKNPSHEGSEKLKSSMGDSNVVSRG